MKKIIIFIPTFNCEKQIARVLAKIDHRIQAYVQEVIIVDNQSTDATIQAAIQGSKNIHVKFTIFKNFENYNLGGSIKRAFLYALEQGYDYMVSLHGDDQADIRDFLPVLESESRLQNDLLIGARFHPLSRLEGYSFVRILGNRCLNILCSIVTQRPIHDLIAGLNCFKLSFFKDKFFLKFPNNLTFDAHILLYALSHGAQVEYLPITWREEDQISNAKVFKQAWIILKLLSCYVFSKRAVFSRNKSEHLEDFNYPAERVYSQ